TEEWLCSSAQASAVLAASLDPEAASAAVARLAVPRVADWCAVHIPGEEGSARLVTVVHADPAKVALAQQLHQRYPPTLETARGICYILQTGESTFLPDVPDSFLP